jgi:hypothetical protein
VERKLASLFPKKERPDEIRELNEDRLSYYFCADRDFESLLQEAKAALSHKYPKGQLKEIFGEALKVLLVKKAKEHTSKKLPLKLEDSTRRVPRHIKEVVWKRDGGCCSYLSETGRRCEETHFLEWDHIYPWALGGRSDDADNIRLLCRAHNKLMATQHFGMEFIEKKIAEKETGFMIDGSRNRFQLDVLFSGGLRNYRETINS